MLPTGGEPNASRNLNHGVPLTVPNQNWSWAYQLLPYLEQENLWKNTDDALVQGTKHQMYFCPGRRRPMAKKGLAKIDYAGNGGTDRTNGNNGTVTRKGSSLLVLPEGIPDGTAYTTLMAEKRWNHRQPGTHQGGNGSYVTGWDNDTIRWATDNILGDCNDCPGAIRFGGLHGNRLNVLFADGSVRVIRHGITQQLWSIICRRNDELSWNEDDL